MNVFDTLKERGFVEQTTHEDEIIKLLENEKVTFYIGFDPTADSLTVGHFLTVMAMSHMQKAGHRPIALVGGGTGMVGDPTDRTDMRKMMNDDEISHNVECFKKQLSRFIDFSEDKAIIVNNADWLRNLNYIEFIREIGVHFSVNRMLTAECFKTRMEKGLSFFEFNYMLMQSYDFLELNRRYNCKMQLGGNDQWSNILGGVDLIRRVENKDAYGLTFKLLTTSDGRKMGKTQKGAVWLDPDKTTPYEFYQYWRNIDDGDVGKCLGLLTFLPMDEVRELSALKDSKINHAKEVLAFELTKIVHGSDEAKKAQNAARSLFAGAGLGGSVPTTEISKEDFGDGIGIIEALEKIKLSPSRGESRRLIKQGGVKVADKKIDSIDFVITYDMLENDEVLIQKGKKSFHRIKIV